MQAWIDGMNLMELNEFTVAVRLALALVCGGILGLERTRKQRAAGMRTYMLVCIGSAVVMMTAQFMTNYFTMDPSRMPAQVVCGIGFLGAGTIMVTRHYRVKGLTTAAGLWTTACIGMAVGIGFYFGALLTCGLLLMVLLFADRIEILYCKRLRRLRLFVLFRELDALKAYTAAIEGANVTISDMEIAPTDSSQAVGLFCILRVPEGKDKKEVVDRIRKIEGVLFVEEIEN